jgi:2-polyprenyl-3-methyl-5-hydroxy-6-metoxy-1,4-benzoquinol methylase
VEENGKVVELAEMVRAIRERVAANYPTEGAAGLRLPDLLPVIHARDAAEGKVAAIGTVNPRPPGIVNDITQAGKRAIARFLDWHVREQVEFNRGILSAIDALIETQNESNRALATLSARVAAMEEPAAAVKDVTGQWAAWREEWQIKLLRGVAELQHAFQHRTSQMESSFLETLAESRRGSEAIRKAHEVSLERSQEAFRELSEAQRDAVRSAIAAAQTDLEERFERTVRRVHEDYRQALTAASEEIQQHLGSHVERLHGEYQGALAKASGEIQTRLWADLHIVQRDTQAAIHRELRILRQRAAVASRPAPATTQAEWPPIDWMHFAEKFRGPEEAIRKSFERYLAHFRGAENVLDLGCGRGEFLELMRDHGITARGIDLNTANVALCRAKGLEAIEADIFDYLAEQPDASVGGVFCAQVIEHLPPPATPRLIELCARKLRRGAPIVFETPNPECLAIFATHFYIDPTHVRPLPPSLTVFYLEEAGFVEVAVDRFASAPESWPELEQLPAAVRERFFGFLDYAVSARNAS